MIVNKHFVHWVRFWPYPADWRCWAFGITRIYMKRVFALVLLLAFASVITATDYRWEPAAGGRTWLWHGNTLAGCQYDDGTYMAFVAGSDPFEADPPIPCCGNQQPVQVKDPPKPPPARKFKTGAKKTPNQQVIEALRTGTATVHRATTVTPAQVIVVPKKLSMWGNDTYGDCVSAEAAFAMAAYSTYIGLPEIFIPDTTLIAWAKSHGFLDGADLLTVSQAMQKDGITDDTGTLHREGVPSVVQYTDESVLKNAISVGPVQIAIDSTALPQTAGYNPGWYAFGGAPGSFTNTDHCISIAGFGPTTVIAAALGVPVPPGAPANTYVAFTWNTLGIVDFAWIQSTCAQAFLRTPTVAGLTPTPPQPPQPPQPPVTGTYYTMATSAAGVITFTPTAAPTGVTAQQQVAVQAAIQACNAAANALQAAFPAPAKGK